MRPTRSIHDDGASPESDNNNNNNNNKGPAPESDNNSNNNGDDPAPQSDNNKNNNGDSPHSDNNNNNNGDDPAPESDNNNNGNGPPPQSDNNNADSPQSDNNNHNGDSPTPESKVQECLKIEHTVTNNNKYWTKQNCKESDGEDTKLFKKPFLCQFESLSFTESTSRTLKIPFEDSMKIELWWNYTFQGQFLLDNWTSNKTMTGFNMSWHIEDSEGETREITMDKDNKELEREQTETRMFGDLVDKMKKSR